MHCLLYLQNVVIKGDMSSWHHKGKMVDGPSEPAHKRNRQPIICLDPRLSHMGNLGGTTLDG